MADALSFIEPTEPVGASADQADDAAEPEGVNDLGTAGKKALDAMKAQLKQAREELAELRSASGDKRGDDAIRAKARREAQDEIDGLKAKLEGREKEYDEQKQRRDVEAAALAKANERILRAEVRAIATGKLADPADALRLLDLTDFSVSDDGEVDQKKVEAAIADLVEKKPYLAAQGGKRFTGTADGGTRNGSTRPAQLTEQDLKRMTPEAIVKAREAGQFNDLLGVT